MRRILIALTAAVMLLIAVPASPASADPGPFYVVVDETATPVGDGSFLFEGVVIGGNTCAGGSVDTTPDGPVTGTRVLRFDVIKTFDCGGGDGFVIDLSVVLFTRSGRTVGSWTLSGGTGAFAGDTGAGVLFGSPDAAGIDDTYIGFVR